MSKEELKIEELQRLKNNLQRKISVLDWKMELLMKEVLKEREIKTVKSSSDYKAFKKEPELGSDVIRRFYYNRDIGIVEELKDELPKLELDEVYLVTTAWVDKWGLVITKLIELDEKLFEKEMKKK